MKKLIFMAAAVIAIGTIATAESYPAEGLKSYQSMQDGFDLIGTPYVGIGYSYMNTNMETDMDWGENRLESDLQGNAITLLGGYNINQYFAVEGRYSFTVGDLSMDASFNELSGGVDLGGDMSNIALYVKPMYSSGKVTIYGLLGYGRIELELDGFPGDVSESGIQWGLGLSFVGGEHLNIFMDYTNLYRESAGSTFQGFTADLVIDSFNFGLAYKF